MASHVLDVGSVRIISLSDGGAVRPPAPTYPSAPADAWQSRADVAAYLNDDGNIGVNYGSFLINEGGTWTLVDTGVGNRGGAFPVGKLDQELAAAGVTPDEVSRVLLTHLHPDHIGWNTVDGAGGPVVLFKKARHIVQRADFEYFMEAGVWQRSALIGLCAAPVQEAGLFDLVEGDATISPAISTIFTPGHTPGHQSILISSGGQKAVITGDVTNSPVQVLEPDWSARFDMDGTAAAGTRAALFDRIEAEGMTMCAGHYPFPSFGGIVRLEGKRRWQPR